jgi:hypothetical protein
MMNLYDDKDDSLSRLFRDSQNNLDSEMPSRAVWDKIEARLDANPSVKIPIKNVFLQFTRRYAVAASLILGLASVGLVWAMFSNTNTKHNLTEIQQKEKNLALSNTPKSINELPVNQKEAEAIYKKEDSTQAANLEYLKTNNQPKETNEIPSELRITKPQNKPLPTVVIENSTTVDKNNSLLSNTIAILKTAETEKTDNKPDNKADILNFELNSVKDNAGDFPNDVSDNVVVINNAKKIVEKKVDSKKDNSNINYASPISPSVDEVKNINSIALEETAKSENQGKNPTNKAKNRNKPNKEAAYAQKLNPRMKMLAWLVGKWQDDSRYDGISYEEWTIKDANTLQGRGYKLKNKDRIFDETMTIRLDENQQQIFLQMSVDDYKTPVLYMLSGINPEELTFSLDMPSNDYPEKIILQRSLAGYTMITYNSSKELSSNQQSFLNNRNVVNTQRAVRNMRPSDK